MPAIKITDAYTHAVILDSNFTGGHWANAAIDIVDTGHGIGHLFARNVEVDGYGTGINKNGVTVQLGNVKHYVSDPTQKFSADMPDTSMNLPIEELPFVPRQPSGSKGLSLFHESCPRG